MPRFSRFLTRAFAACVLLGVPALLVYLQLVGFTGEWRAKVARALGGPTFSVEIGRLTFHPFEGIVAEKLVLHRRLAPARRLAEIDRMIVSPNLADLLRGRVSIDRLDLENTDVEIPFAEDGVAPDSIHLQGLRAEVWSGNGQVTVSHAECRVEGIHVTLRGHFLMPEIKAPRTKPSTPEHVMARAAVIRKILETLRRIRFSGAPPELDVSLGGDLAYPDSIVADSVTLRSGGVRFEDLSFDRLSLAASYEDRVAHLTNLRIAGKSGTLQIAGSWNAARGTGGADLSGALTLAPLLRLAGQAELAQKISFDHPPAVEASMEVTPGPGGPQISVIGQTSAREFWLKGVRGKSFASRFAWKDGRLYLQDAVLRSRTGSVRAQVLTGRGEFRLKLESDADPTEFLDLFGPKEQAIIGLLKFKDPPRIAVSLDGTRPSLDALAGKGTLSLGRSSMRDSWIDSGKSDFEVVDRSIVYRNLVLAKGDLQATGSFTYDFGRHEVRLDGIRSNLNPTDVLMWVDPRIAATVAVYRFRGPADLRADGIAHMADPRRNDLRIRIDAPGGLAYTLLNRDLLFGPTRATVRLKGQELRADVTQAELMGGVASIEARVSIAPDDPSFHADVSLEEIDFPAMTKLYFGYSKSEGVLSGKYAFDSSLKEPAKMRGTGSIRVEKGQVLSIPVFGPLSVIISQIIPGAGHESARLATADFAIANQEITTENLDIRGAGFELFGDGKVGFPSGKMDLTVRINARGIPGLMLFPVSKLFEYVSTGTVSDPQWLPKVIPREFFNVLGMGKAVPSKEVPPKDAARRLER